MPDLSQGQKRQMFAVALLFRVAVASFLIAGCLCLYYWYRCPVTPNPTSRHVYAFFDKIHSRYVYLTETENKVNDFALILGVICVFGSVAIDLNLKRSVARHNNGIEWETSEPGSIDNKPTGPRRATND